MSKSVFLTGASGGLGAGMAREFARRGYTLVLTARRTEKLEELATELRTLGAPNVLVRHLDVTDYDSIPRVMGEVATELGSLDIVVANSGVGGSGGIGRGAFERARCIMETNAIGAMATVDAAVELFRRQGYGHVVGVSSVAGVRGLPMQGAYSASKAALSNYLQAARAELRGSKIQVTDLAPGFIDTAINQHMASRPFVVSAQKGTAAMVALIESGVSFAYVPRFPWTPLAMLLRVLPSRFLTMTN